MKNKKIIFFAVDCQKDFINPNGALYVEGAENIKPNLKKLTDFARENNIMVVNTRDYHFSDDEELSDNPDFINTFPKHCMEGTEGMNFITETCSEISSCSILHMVNLGDAYIKLNSRNVIINKNKFDIFTGNHHTNKFLDLINPDIVVVYGVAGDYCVKYAIEGLIKKVDKVIVIIDAIKAIKENPIKEWQELGIQMGNTEEIFKFIKEIKNEI